MNLSDKTVHQLRKDGYKLRINHSRFVSVSHGCYPIFEIRKIKEQFPSIKPVFNPRGGSTEILLTTPDQKQYRGVSNCSLSDNFNYKIGVKVALGRLVEVKELNQST